MWRVRQQILMCALRSFSSLVPHMLFRNGRWTDTVCCTLDFSRCGCRRWCRLRSRRQSPYRLCWAWTLRWRCLSDDLSVLTVWPAKEVQKPHDSCLDGRASAGDYFWWPTFLLYGLLMTKKVSSDPERMYSPVSFQQIVLTCSEPRIWIMSDWILMPMTCGILN